MELVAVVGFVDVVGEVILTNGIATEGMVGMAAAMKTMKEMILVGKTRTIVKILIKKTKNMKR
jgi:hypothetical protein